MPNTFRFQGKNIFLTYSQCPLSPSVVSSAIVSLLPGKIDYGLVGQENHKEQDIEGCQGLHLHVTLVMKKRFSTRNCRFFDLSLGEDVYHPKIEKVRSLQHALVYTAKEGNVVGIGCNWEMVVKAAKEKTGTKNAVIASKIMDGCSLKEVEEMYPGFLLLNLNKVQNYKRWWQAKQVWNAPLLPWNGCRSDAPGCLVTESIVKWLNSNMGMTRRPRKKQLWIYGPSATGKTFLILQLLKHFHGYSLPYDNKWFDGYSDKFGFIYADEFHGQYPVTLLNKLVEGCPCPLSQRGQKPYIKRKNLPVIIVSNSCIRDTYKNCDDVRLEALEYRFHEVCTSHGMRINVKLDLSDEGSDEDTVECISSDEECGTWQ